MRPATPMIVGCKERLDLGTVIHAEYNRFPNKPQPAQPFYVVREATRAEWEAWVLQDQGELPVIKGPEQPGPFFYEVTTD